MICRLSLRSSNSAATAASLSRSRRRTTRRGTQLPRRVVAATSTRSTARLSYTTPASPPASGLSPCSTTPTLVTVSAPVDRQQVVVRETLRNPCTMTENLEATPLLSALASTAASILELLATRRRARTYYIRCVQSRLSFFAYRDLISTSLFRFVTRTSDAWLFQESRLDNEYDTRLVYPAGLELVRTDDVVNNDANQSASPASNSTDATTSPLSPDPSIPSRPRQL